MPGLAVMAAVVWLGILTSISPCPLATNVAAISFIARHVGRVQRVVLAGIAYTVGRALAYAVLAVLAVEGLLAIPALSFFLQHHLNQLLGPLLILVGMVLLDLVHLPVSTTVGSEALLRRAATSGLLGAAALGILFALSFCPVSAALFFGSLIPMAVDHHAPVSLGLLFGLGTGLPVLLLAAVIGSGGAMVGRVLDRIVVVERWIRGGTGAVIIAVGLYLTLRYVFLA